MEENTSIIQAYNINDEKVYPKVLIDSIEYTPASGTSIYGGDAIGASLAGKELMVGDLIIDSSYYDGNTLLSFVNMNTATEKEKAELNIDIARINTTGNRGLLNINTGSYKQNCDLTAYFNDASVTNAGKLEITANKTTINGDIDIDGSLHINGSLLPLETDSYNLGSKDKAWNYIHANDIHLSSPHSIEYGGIIYFGDSWGSTQYGTYIGELSNDALTIRGNDDIILEADAGISINSDTSISGKVSMKKGLIASAPSYYYKYVSSGNLIRKAQIVFDSSQGDWQSGEFLTGNSGFRVEILDGSVYNTKETYLPPSTIFAARTYENETQINMKADKITIDGSTKLIGTIYEDPSNNMQYIGGGIVIGGTSEDMKASKFIPDDASHIYSGAKILFNFWDLKWNTQSLKGVWSDSSLVLDASTASSELYFRLRGKKTFAFDKDIITDGSLITKEDVSIKGTCYSKNGFYETSDIRKKNIKSELSLEKCYELVDKCQEIVYTLKDSPDKEQIGMIAQEVEDFFPELVMKDSAGFKSLDYSKLGVVCLRLLKDIIDKGNFDISKK